MGSELGSGLATPLVKESLRLEGWAAAAGTWEKAAAPPGIEPRRPGHKPPRAVRRGWTARGHCRRSTQATTGVRGRSSWKFLSTWVDERGDLGEQELGWDPPRVLSPQTSRLGGACRLSVSSLWSHVVAWGVLLSRVPGMSWRTPPEIGPARLGRSLGLKGVRAVPSKQILYVLCVLGELRTGAVQ